MRRTASLAIATILLAMLAPAARASGAPAAPVDLTASDGWGGVSVYLSWQAPDDNGSPIEQYWVERAQGGEFALVANLSDWQTYYHDANVTPHTSYQYRVFAVNAYGPGEPAHVNWTTHDVASAPHSLTAAGSAEGIALAWDPPLDPQGFTHYTVYRLVDGELWWLAWLNATNESWFDDAVEPGESRTYSVAADNAYGPGDLADPATGTRTGGAPSAPQNLTASDGWGSVSIQLAWQPPADAGGAPLEAYWLERANETHPTFELVANLSANVTWYHDGNLTANTSYQYRLRAVNAFGPGQAAQANRTTGAMPSAPRDLTATGQDDGILLGWTPPAEGAGFTAYTVYRVVDGELWWLASVTSGLTEHLDDTAAPGETRTYVVAAKNVYGNGPPSNEATGTRHDLPSAPRNLSATLGLGKVNLRWDAPLDDGGSALLTYRIWRGANPSNMTLIHGQNANDRDYSDLGCSLGTCYYRVSATNGVGEGPRSEYAVAIG